MDNPSNRLIHEKSPYLLQHAYNPVNWYPWGDEAFEESSGGEVHGAARFYIDENDGGEGESDRCAAL